HGGALAGAPVFPVNATDPDDTGLAALRAHLEDAAQGWGGRSDGGLFRLAVDRGFTLPGHCTVVTGTVFGGRVVAGAETTRLVLAPAGTPLRVRSIHAQDRPSPDGRAGQRCALNLAGIERDAIRRGDWVADTRAFVPARNIDVELQLLERASVAVGDWTPLHVHLGTSRRLAHAVPLDAAGIGPGGTGRVQLVFDEPLCAAPGDRFILRDANAAHTIGGGRVLDPGAPRRRRRSPQRMAWLDGVAAMLDGAGLEPLLAHSEHGIDEAALVRLTGLPPERLELPASARWLAPRSGPRVAITGPRLAALRARIGQALADFHADSPDEPGPEAARLRRIALPTAPAALWQVLLDELVDDGTVRRNGVWLHLPGHRITLDEADAALGRQLLERLAAAGPEPLWVRDLARAEAAPEERVRRVLRTLALQGDVFQVVRDLFFHRERMREMAELVATLAAGEDGLAAAGFRDATGLGRKRAIQILEFFDRTGLTRRVRDTHLLRPDSAWLQDLRTRRGAARRACDSFSRPMEGKRARWRGRASNPVGGVSRSQAGSTPVAFRHFPPMP